MSKLTKSLTAVGMALILSGCNLVRKTPKDEFTDSWYVLRADGQRQRVYVDMDEDSIHVYHPDAAGRLTSSPARRESFPKLLSAGNSFQRFIFQENSFDVDFFTMPVKYRPGLADVPPQLVSSLNGSLFLGYRSDRYYLTYPVTPLGIRTRELTHVGYAVGLFSGLSSAPFTAATALRPVTREYEGVAWSRGISGIVAVNKITVGLSLGFDHLLDVNRSAWLFQDKPWLGVTFGLNLN